MASIYRNGSLYWIKLRHPVDGSERRISLQTGSRAAAELLRRKWEAYEEFFRREIQDVPFPESLRALTPGHWHPSTEEAVRATNSSISKPGKPLGDVLREYLAWCRSANDPKHAAGKVAIVRAAFGRDVPEGAVPDGPLAVECLERLACAQVLAFIEARPGRKSERLAESSKRHYKECFVQIVNFALRNSDMVPSNLAFPNPMTLLPEWGNEVEEIVFLTEAQIEEQLSVLKPFPSLHAAVATMIHAGLRRAEALWLTCSSMNERNGERYFSIRKVRDGAVIQSLKTKSSVRSVTIDPSLAAVLDVYVPSLSSKWLFPSPKGLRWDKDHFSQRLAEVNDQHGLPWSAMHYRHTYATQRAAAGLSVFALAHEMGTSVAMVMKHYAAFFPPSALR